MAYEDVILGNQIDNSTSEQFWLDKYDDQNFTEQDFKADLKDRGILDAFMSWLNLFRDNGPIYNFFTNGEIP